MYGIESSPALRSYTSSVPSWGLSKAGNQQSYSSFLSRTGSNSNLKIKDKEVWRQFMVTRRRRGTIGTREVVFYEKYVSAIRTKKLYKDGVFIKTITKNIYSRRKRTRTIPVKGWVYYRIPKWIKIPNVGSSLFVPPNRLSLTKVNIINDNATTVPIKFRGQSVGQTIINGILKGTHAENTPFGMDIDGILNEGLPPSIFKNLDDLTTVKLYEKFRNGIASLTTMAAESKKTSAMLIDYCTRILQGVVSAKRQLAKEIATFGSRKGLASEYLKGIYGVVPFVSDVASLRNQLSQETRVWRTYRAVEKLTWTTAGHVSLDGCVMKWTVDHKVVVKKQATIDGSQPFSSFRPPGIGTMLDTAWEVVPWSFVIDWFVPIGNYLNSLDILNNVQVKSYHVSTLYTKTLNVNVTYPISNSSPWRVGPGGAQSAFAKKVTFDRIIPQSIPGFPLYFSGKGLTEQRSLNAFFLALQQLGRK